MTGNSLTEEHLAKQRKKIEKDQRRKKYADIAVQGTNDYSIVSKRSVEKLYTAKINEGSQQYFQHFVKKFQRRSPAINRGYWTRMEAIKNSSYQIIQDSVAHNKKVVIINLGAGYDPLAFQYLDELNPENANYKGMLSFIDVDYPDLNKIKIEMINNSIELKTIIGDQESSDFEGVDLKTKNYTALSCNLKNIDLFLKQLNYLNLNDPNITKIYIAEVSIAYMKPEYADPVIKATSQLPNSHFLLLEQLLPSGVHQGFARTMMYHFNKLNSPLNSVETYPTISSQIKRFQDAGYKSAEALDLETFWRSLPMEVRNKVSQIEAFDEWEEFILFAQHYLILHASDTDLSLFEMSPKYEFDEPITNNFSIQPRAPELERKFIAADAYHDEIMVHGGAFMSRLNSTLMSSGFNIKSHDMAPRQAHTLTILSDSAALLIGGRTAPNKPLSEVWTLTLDTATKSWEWKEANPLPEPRARHSTFTYEGGVMVYGGCYKGSSFVVMKDSEWLPLQSNVPGKKSAAVGFNGSRGVIIGGMNSDETIDSTLHVFTIHREEVVCEKVMEHPLLNRYGAQVEFISDNELLLVGGVSELLLHDKITSVVKINLLAKTVTPVRLPDSVWEKLPLLVGFQLVKYRDRLVTLGGGAVCYSFGSIWNDHLIIGDELQIPTLHIEEI